MSEGPRDVLERLWDGYAAAVPGTNPGSPAPALMSALAQAMATAKEAHPGLALEPERFGRAIGERADTPPPEGIEGLKAADLYLATAAAAGVAGAPERLEPVFAELMPVLAGMGLRDASRDEVLQRLREKMLVGGGTPAIARYAGRAPLRNFLKAAAAREAIGVIREGRVRHKAATDQGDDDLLVLADEGADPEWTILKSELGAAFKRAFEAAVAALTSRQRTLLRLHLLDGLTIDQLAPIYGVHRATAARWLAAARTSLHAGVETTLQAEAGLDREALESALAKARSQLDLSLSRLFAVEADPKARDE